MSETLTLSAVDSPLPASASPGSSTAFEVTTSRAAELLSLDPAAIRMRCIRGVYEGAHRDNTGQWIIPLVALGLPVAKQIELLTTEQACCTHPSADIDTVANWLDSLPGWQRSKVLGRKAIVDEFIALPLEQWGPRIEIHRASGTKLSTTTLYRWIGAYKKDGAFGLATEFGNRDGATAVPQKAFEIFESLALQESSPSYNQIYTIVKGMVEKLDPSLALPAPSAFVRQLKKKHRKPYLDLCRRGYRYYQRNHEYFIRRDLSAIRAGEGWYSDHHQLDVIVTSTVIENGRETTRQFRPWVTVWRDVRTGKMLSAYCHEADPNSDHIFYAFYLAAKEYGLPDFVYIDNGKDYRVRDFSGMTRRHKPLNIQSQEYARSLLGMLNIEVLFATPYNAQAKAVERDFQKIIGQFAKFMRGYTGKNSASRPESTEKQCARGDLMNYSECEKLLEQYMREIFNRTPSNGRALKGMCPDEAWEKLRKESRTVSAESLKLCLMRTSRAHKIDRNGINDTELGIEMRYWAEWMFPLRGTSVYIRRDIKAYQECWCWDSETERFLGKADLVHDTPLRADTPLDREALKTEIKRKRSDLKRAREATRPKIKLTADEIMGMMAAGTQSLNRDRGYTPGSDTAVNQVIQTTEMDTAMAQHIRMERTGTDDISMIVPPVPEPKRKLFMFECEKERQ